MKCVYVGKSEAHYCREASLTYSASEEENFNKMYDALTEIGWNLACEEECAGVEVHDKEEYEEFYADYKRIKAMLRKE